MKKALYIVLAAVLCALLSVAAVADTEVPTTCQACGTAQTWEVMPESWADLKAGHYHFYLSDDVTPKQLVAPKDLGVTVCLDLNGHSIKTDGRAMIAYNQVVLNIMDSSSSADGYVCGSTGSNNTASGTVAVSNGGTLRLHSGALKFEKDDTGTGLCRSGVVGIEKGGAMEMLGGRIEGGELVMTASISTDPGCGAAIYMAGGTTLNISGGEITSGIVPEGGQGPCVFLAGTTAKVTLTGTANVAEICSKALNNITVTGTYTGKATVCYTAAVAVSNGTVIGTAAGADISGAGLFCSNGDGYEIQKSGDDLLLKTFASTEERHVCKHCNTIADWMPVSGNTGLFAAAGHHHLYLTEDYTGKQLNAKDGAQVCLDLYGKDMYTDGRAFHVGANGQLNIMDTVGGSTVTGTSGSNNPTGGTLALADATSVCNIYDGTFKMVQDGEGQGVGTGGIVYMSNGTLNLYGGKLEGGELVLSDYELSINGYGAAVYMNNSAQLNMYGGAVTSGTVPDGGLGECVYLNSTNAKVKLSGSGSVEEIYCKKDTQPITVTGTYTGTAAIRFPEDQAILEEMPVGTCAGADISGAKLSCVNGSGYALVDKDGVLVVSSFGLEAVAAACNSTGAVGCETLQAAIDACTDGYVKLLKSSTEAAFVTKDLYVDLNGQSAALTLSEGVTVYGFDSQTDDYTVADGKYGKLTVTGGTVTGLPVDAPFAEDSYLAVLEAGKYSFHRVKLQIYAMSLRPEKVGLYYKSHFLADEKAAAQISSYGVALSVVDVPNASNLDLKCLYSTFTGFESGPAGNLGNASSTLLKGILKETNSDSENTRNLNTRVYGRAYAKTADGQLLLGQAADRTLAEQLTGVDAILPTLSQVQAKGAVEMYKKYAQCLSGLQLPNLAAAVQEEEAGTLKILSLGHSHGLDGSTLLYEVFKSEMPEQEVVVGALYYSGCRIRQHADFLTRNAPVYTYYKKDSRNENGEWNVALKETTGLYALQDEQWDVIVIQDANYDAGMESSYNVDNYMTVINYLYNNQEVKPRILFHMTWTNPDDYDTYINPDSSLSHPDQSWYRPYMESRYADENGVYQREIHIDKILSYTEKYLEDCTEFLGEKYIESVIPAATAVEYAQYVCDRTDAEIYRDWTHMNDYGRMIVAYTWYARIMRLDQISKVNMLEVPAGAHQKNSKFPADLKFDAQMRADALAAINFALANPYKDIVNGDVTPIKPDPVMPDLPGLLQVDNSNLALDASNQAKCPVCDKVVTWTAITDTSAPQKLTGGSHYYLPNDLTFEKVDLPYIQVASGDSACLHLNGHNITATNAMAILANGTMNIMGNGIVSGNGYDNADLISSPNLHAATIETNSSKAVLNLYGGTYVKSESNDSKAKPNHIVGVHGTSGGTVNMFEGAVVDARNTKKSAVVSYWGMFNLYGGTVYGGSDTAVNAANWTNSKSGSVSICGGTVQAGTGKALNASGSGNGIATLNIYGGLINGTTTFNAVSRVTVAGSPVMSRLTVTNGLKLVLGQLTEGAQIKVDASGIFTGISANAAKYAEYFEPYTAGKAVTVVEDALSCG